MKRPWIMKSVFVINGFLEAGKTEFISYTLAQPYFRTKGRTLLVLCEEGEVEYDPKLLAATNTDLVIADSLDDVTPAKLLEYDKKYRPERIIIEWNGMWDYKTLKLPMFWKLDQQITVIDGSTFSQYYSNMRSLLAEQMRKSEMIIMNRCDGIIDSLPGYRRNIKAVNQQAAVIFEGAEGEINTIFEEDLPYDLNADPIDLGEDGYGIWFIDTSDNLDRYIGKTVKFLAMVYKPTGFPKGYFVPGRMVMACCADDMQFLGYACKYDKVSELTDKSWVTVTAKVTRQAFAAYEDADEGPVLEAISVVPANKPKEEVISFS